MRQCWHVGMCEFEKMGEAASDSVVNMNVLVLGISWKGMI
jgi:hypothetical protein